MSSSSDSSESNVWTDLFATAQNLSLLWPHDSVAVLHTRIMQTAEAAFHVVMPKVRKGKKKTKKAKKQDVQLVSTLDDDREALLASFPNSYAAALSVIVCKWNYYFRVYQALRAMEAEPDSDEAKWKDDLLDYWGRTVLFIERVLEVAIQWANDSDQSETCHVLRLFMAQEAIDTVHTPSKTSEYQISRDDETALFRSMRSMISTGSRTDSHSCSDCCVEEGGSTFRGALLAQ